MCHAYPSFYLGEWIADSREFPNLELKPQGKARCVDWESLDRWALARAVEEGWKAKPGPFEKVHPTTNPVD